MPNNVRNIVKMEGIVNLPLFRVEDGVKCFDFNKVIHMPESLSIESGSMTDEYILYYMTEKCTIPVNCIGEEKLKVVRELITNTFSNGDEWIRTVFVRVMEKAYKETESKKNEMYQKGKTYLDNYEKYGYTTWYDWCIKYWGTKWNTYSNEQQDEDTIIFKTAWSNPEPVMLKLSEMYPEAVIEHWWADEDMGSNDGYRVYRGGEIVEGDYYDLRSNEAYETYIKCWGKSECLEKDVEGNWRHKDCDACHGCD